MGRTSREQELVVDLLDDLMTFAYVYEGELGLGGQVPDLEALARSVAACLEEGPKLGLFRTPSERRTAVFIVLNRLQQDVGETAMPGTNDVERAWIHISPQLTIESLRANHAIYRADLLQLVEAAVERLAADPADAREFMTREQVRGTLLATLPAVSTCEACPIHLQSLVNLVHQHFLEAFNRTIPREALSWGHVVDQYMDLAERSVEERAKQLVLDALVRQYLPAARSLRIGIGRFYSWATVWAGPVPAADLLAVYARLNASRTLSDKKYTGKPEGGASPL